jgi:hypothetical protein
MLLVQPPDEIEHAIQILSFAYLVVVLLDVDQLLFASVLLVEDLAV